jgi:hypothetical protein
MANGCGLRRVNLLGLNVRSLAVFSNKRTIPEPAGMSQNARTGLPELNIGCLHSITSSVIASAIVSKICRAAY